MPNDHGHGWIDPEPRDADIGLVVKTGIGILLGVFICMVIAVLQFKFETKEAPQEQSFFKSEGKLPPEPRLQVFPAKDLDAFREAQLHRLNHYGWADKENEIASIPVEKAEEMVMKEGLPVWDRSKPIQLAPEKPAAKPGAPGAPQQAAGHASTAATPASPKAMPPAKK